MGVTFREIFSSIEIYVHVSDTAMCKTEHHFPQHVVGGHNLHADHHSVYVEVESDSALLYCLIVCFPTTFLNLCLS